MCQSEPQSSQAINKKFGVEMLKPYDTPLGEPVRALVMTEKLYKEQPDVAQRVLDCFVEATSHFIDEPEGWPRSTCASRCSRARSPPRTSRTPSATRPSPTTSPPEHIQVTTDLMVKYGVGKMTTPPKAADWVKLDLLQKAKAEAGREVVAMGERGSRRCRGRLAVPVALLAGLGGGLARRAG